MTTADRTAADVLETAMWSGGGPHEVLRLLQSAPESDRRLLAAALIEPRGPLPMPHLPPSRDKHGGW